MNLPGRKSNRDQIQFYEPRAGCPSRECGRQGYITDQLEAKYQANRIATNWLQERQEQLREQADAAQRAVDTFKKQNNIVTTDAGKLLDNAQVADLNARLVAARTQTSDILARLSRLEAIVRLGSSNTNIDGTFSEHQQPNRNDVAPAIS